MAKKIAYRVWTIIEIHTVNEKTGKETYKDLKTFETKPLGPKSEDIEDCYKIIDQADAFFN